MDDRVVRAYAEARKMRWAYGVTTVSSRLQDLLPRTLESLRLAGFDAPRLFVDGDTDSNNWGRLQYEKTFRYPPLRTHGNWWLALHELYIRNPNVDRYAIFQDDLVTCRNLRAYLESTPSPDKGYLNLYTIQQNLDLCPHGRKGFYLSNQMGRGALALVFDNAACVALLSSGHMVQRAKDPIRGHKVVDGGIVTALGQAGFREYVHNPSLVYHTGEVSTLGKATPSPQAANFVGEDFDALQLLRQEKVVQA